MREFKSRDFLIKTIDPIKNPNYFPSKYIEEKYPQLNKVVPKYSILHKVKYKPDLEKEKDNALNINNNKSINIKKNIFLSTKKNQSNNITEQKYYEINTNNTLLNYLDENDINNISGPKYIEESPIRLSEHKLVNNDNSFQNFLIERNNLNNEFFINPIVLNEKSQIEKKMFKNRINKDYGYNKTNYLKIDDSTHINNNIEEININTNTNTTEEKNTNNSRNYYNNNNNNLYLKYMNNHLDSNNLYEYSHHIINSSENFNYNKLKSFKENSLHKPQLNEIFFSPKNNKNKTIDHKNVINNNYKNKEKTNKCFNIKLNYYRMRLCKEFFKYFKNYCKKRLAKIFSSFFTKINNNNNKNVNNNTNINDNQIIINKHKKIIFFQSSGNVGDNIEINNDTKENISKYYKKICAENIKNKIDNLKKSNKHNNISNMIKEKSYIGYIGTDPRIKKNNKITFIKRNDKENTNTETNASNSLLSPSFHFKNGAIIYKNISFRTEDNDTKENELYRNMKGLNEKYEQIQKRKSRSKHKSYNSSIIHPSTNTGKMFITSDINLQLNQIRKYMKSIKNEKNENNTDNKNKINDNKIINNFNRINKRKNIVKIKKINNNKTKNYDKKNNNNKDKNASINKLKNIIKKNGAFLDNKKLHNLSSNQNYYYYYIDKNKVNNNNIKNYKVYLIKNISTTDHRVNITINYYCLSRKDKTLRSRYNNLSWVNNCIINYIYNNISDGNFSYKKKHGIKLKHKLSSIQEENDNNIGLNEKKI